MAQSWTAARFKRHISFVAKSRARLFSEISAAPSLALPSLGSYTGQIPSARAQHAHSTRCDLS